MAIPQTIRLNQGWRLGTQLGQGGMAQVFVAEAEGKPPAVVKLIPKDPGADRELLFEDLAGVPNVIPILDRGAAGKYWALVPASAVRRVS